MTAPAPDPDGDDDVPDKVLLIDGHGLFHRAFHGLPPLTASNGQPTNAVYGFISMMLDLVEQEAPQYVAVALDLPGPTFRDEIYREYKAHRPPMDDALRRQIPLLGEAIEALGIRGVGVEGFEADDVIGTLARVAADDGNEVMIVTGDKDMLQLVRPGVVVMATVKGIKETKLYDEDAVQDEYGLTPAQIVDLKALAGDSSDNIPGVSGIGDKSAKMILAQCANLEEAIASADEIKPTRMGKLLSDGRDMARLSRELATIKQEVPVEVGLDDCRWDGPAVEELRELATRLEFTSLLSRLPAVDGTLDEAAVEMINDAAAMTELAEAARAEGAICLALVGDALAVSVRDGMTGIVQLRGDEPAADNLFSTDGDASVDMAPLAEALADPAIRKRGADLKSIIRRLRAFDLSVRGADFDPEIASYLVTPNRRDHSVDLLAQQYLGIALPDGETVDDESDPAQVRAGAEAAAVRALREPMLDALAAADLTALFDEMEIPLVEVLAEMELAGIALDLEKLSGLGDELTEMLGELQSEVYDLAGAEFNIGSPKQLGEVLFDKLGLPKGRRTKTGWSTNAAVLDELADEHEVVGKVLKWREYSKLKSTYVDGLAREVDAETGRVHTTFEQTVAATGRLSSRNPNLQNIPVRTEWGRRIRSCFVAGAEGNVLIAADYSQIELRILAHISGDSRLVEAFRAGEDIHASTACAIFDVAPADVTKEMRSRAKTVNFAVLYGQGATALAKQLDVERKEAVQFIANYFERLGGVRAYIDGTVAAAREQLFVTTLLGRKRPIPDINSSNGQVASYAERTAVNTPIQGTAADIIKIAMNQLAPRLAEECPQAAMLLQVHDELVLEAPEEQAARVGALVKEVMESAFELDVPLTVDVSVGRNWRDMTGFEPST
jgi:DNA polymerase-1